MEKIKNKMIYGIIILITLFNILATTGNVVFATGTNNNVIYQKKVEILSTPVIDTKNTNITSSDTDIREEEQKEEELKKIKYNTIEGFSICINFTTLFKFTLFSLKKFIYFSSFFLGRMRENKVFFCSSCSCFGR